MRIAFLSWESLHSIAVGGLAVHVTELAAALQRRGHEVHVFTRAGEGQIADEPVDGVYYHRCWHDPSPDIVDEMENMCRGMVGRVREIAAASSQQFDIVHGHDWLVVPALREIGSEWPTPLVLTFHSTEFGRSGNQVLDGVSERIRMIEAGGVLYADRLITVSRSLGEEVRALYGVPRWRLRSVYNGIDSAPFAREIDIGSCRKRQGLPADAPLILFVGRLMAQKGPDLLLEAMPQIVRQFPRATVAFVGDGGMRPALERRALELGVEQATRFFGALNPGPELAELFASADVLCMPSRNEPFGIVALEAWASGTPVVSTAQGGPAEFVSEGEDGYLVEPTPDAIAAGVRRMLADPERARRMGACGRAKATSAFTWDTVASQTERVYNELVYSPTRIEA